MLVTFGLSRLTVVTPFRLCLHLWIAHRIPEVIPNISSAKTTKPATVIPPIAPGVNIVSESGQAMAAGRRRRWVGWVSEIGGGINGVGDGRGEVWRGLDGVDRGWEGMIETREDDQHSATSTLLRNGQLRIDQPTTVWYHDEVHTHDMHDTWLYIPCMDAGWSSL